MSRRTTGAAVLAAGIGAVVIVRGIRNATQDAGERDARSRWRAVTINRSEADVMPDDRLPAPLAELGDLIEVETRPASGDKGTELRARLRSPDAPGPTARLSGDDALQRIRAALRASKQLIEVGEVLRVDPAPHGHRPATPAGKLVDLATERAPGGGLL